MTNFKLEIVTPTEINKIENVSYVRCPGSDGSFGIMKGHRDAVIALGVGEIKITETGKDFIMLLVEVLLKFQKRKCNFY